jgi:hypothetical protein
MHRIVISLGLALLMLQPVTAHAISLTIGGSGDAVATPPNRCSAIDSSIATVQVREVHAQQDVRVTCPVDQAFFPNHSGPSHQGPVEMTVGDSCAVSWNSDVRISQVEPDGQRVARWDDPPGPEPVAHFSADDNVDRLSTSELAGSSLSAAQADLRDELVYVLFSRQGRWDGARCAGGDWTVCHSRGPGEGSRGPDVCLVRLPYVDSPPDCSGACEDPVVQLAARLNEAAVAGTIKRYPPPASPSNVGPIVNLPVQFFIPDWSLNGRRQAEDSWLVTLIGPPDGLGRSRAYRYVVTLGLTGVDWDFGDGQSAHFGDSAGFGRDVRPPAGSSPVAHAYSRTSRDGRFHVTAEETWAIRVDRYWLGGHAELGRLERQFQIRTATDVEVGQVEAVPVTCPGSCG